MGRTLRQLKVHKCFDADDFIQHVLPCAHGNHRFAVPQINTGKAQVHGGLLASLVHGHEQPRGLGLVLGLLKSIIPRLQWPKPVFRDKRAITAEEHAAIVQREQNAERRDFYDLLWHTGAAQSDGACLRAEDINWEERTICFMRKKLKGRAGLSIKPTLFRFSAEIEALLKRRQASGQLFPYLCTVRAGDRATEFKQRCDGLGISGVSLHSYRYAWAERALKCGFPERFAQQAFLDCVEKY